ncbi:hypothetical protein HPB49_005507 [Dermacentor silvarum]|uniref:Uncharacterized protein n=1 Tax=Dermacentor silvarum TaxID=543639 RepID=A0ACB8DIV7_DERSI|nr:hypothetical protein HPB49_005507 [Dermacentor silvarum]
MCQSGGRTRAPTGRRWRHGALESNTTLQQYGAWKTDICVEPIHDNSVGSRQLFEARAGAFRTYRRRFDTTVECTLCRACGKADEDVEHIVRRRASLQTPPQVQKAALPTALGCRADGEGTRVLAAALTKQRLAVWWTVVRR